MMETGSTMKSAANKKMISFYLLLLTLCLPQTNLHAAKEDINLGTWDIAALELIMNEPLSASTVSTVLIYDSE